MTQSSVSLPPYIPGSTVPALSRLRHRRRPSNVVHLLLNEVNTPQVSEWPDDSPFSPVVRPRQKRDFSNNVAVRTLKLGVGAGVLAVLGFQSLIKGWHQSEIWVKNAVKAVVFSLLSLYLLASCVALAVGMMTVNQEAPVVKGLYDSHRVKNALLKSEIKRIQSGEDAEALARGYLDMVKAGEVLLKIQVP